MIYRRLSAQPASELALISARECWTYGQLLARAERLARELEALAGRRVMVSLSDVAEFLVSLLALDALGATAVVLPAYTSGEKAERVAVQFGVAATLRDLTEHSVLTSAFDPARPNAQSAVVLFTSGTSGEPTPVMHTWNTLAAAVRSSAALRGRRWLLTYQPSTFAGFQVLAQALFTGGCLVVPSGVGGSQATNSFVAHAIEFASGTPTFWRMALHGAARGAFEGAAIRQITLGGEAAGQSLLDRLAATFPDTRITHVYASTEMGVCFSVHDRREGFPLAFLQDPTLPAQLRIEDGELLVRSTRSMTGVLGRELSGGWFRTGDLVEIHEDRVLFVGRRSDTINVGGLKVHPLEVEEIIRTVEGVQEVRVHSVASSMVGELVTARLQPVEGIDREQLRAAVLSRCREKLPKHKVPARIGFVPRVATNAAGKLSRNGSGDA